MIIDHILGTTAKFFLVYMSPSPPLFAAIQALRSVLNSFCVGNRKNMFVYQERTTKSVFYLR